MRQLGELQDRTKELERLGAKVTVAALSIEDKSQGKDVRSKSGFQGPVMVDEGRKIAGSFGATFGSVIAVDPEGVVRWHKPGSKYKRPKLDVVIHGLSALIERDDDPEQVDEALEHLASSNASRRQKAVLALAELEAVDHREAIEALLLEDAKDKVRVAAAEGLALMRSIESLPALAKACGDEDLDVRLAAGRALSEFGNDFASYPGNLWRHEYTHAQHTELVAAADAVRPAAERLLGDRSKEARKLGARILWRVKDPSTRGRLLELTRDRDPEVRYAALGGLEPWRTEKDVRERARDMKKDGSAEVRAMAEYLYDGPEGKIRE